MNLKKQKKKEKKTCVVASRGSVLVLFFVNTIKIICKVAQC